MQYRKKPVVVVARQLVEKNIDGIIRWINENGGKADYAFRGDIDEVGPAAVMINTLEGQMLAKFGDWVIKGFNGEFYSCKPDVFEKTYEVVEP